MMQNPQSARHDQRTTARADIRCLAATGMAGAAELRRAVRAASDLNDVWLLPDLVVRIARSRGPSNLRYESGIAPLLPADVRYPGVVASGQVSEHDWVATRRVDGAALSSMWDSLTEADAIEALEQFVTNLECLHRVSDVPGRLWRLPAHYVFDARRAETILERLVAAGWVARIDAAKLVTMHAAMLEELNVQPPSGLVHGDAHLGNVVWDGKRTVVSTWKASVSRHRTSTFTSSTVSSGNWPRGARSSHDPRTGWPDSCRDSELPRDSRPIGGLLGGSLPVGCGSYALRPSGAGTR